MSRNRARHFRAVPTELSNILAIASGSLQSRSWLDRVALAFTVPSDAVGGYRPFGLIESSASRAAGP